MNICKGCTNTTKRVFCTTKCQQDFQYRSYIERWRRGEESGLRGKTGISAHIRRYLLFKFHSRCSKCGWGSVNPYSNNIPVEVDHIDGNWKNNNEENLTILCPNCHSLTRTFRFMNKGNGRTKNPR